MSAGASTRNVAVGAELVIELQVGDPELRARLTAMLDAVPELRIAAPGEVVDLRLSAAGDRTDPHGDRDAEGNFAQPLTPRERDVIALLAEGLSNKAIGHRLGIASDTAKFHVARIIDKLDATGRTDAVAHAARRGIIHL